MRRCSTVASERSLMNIGKEKRSLNFYLIVIKGLPQADTIEKNSDV